MQQSCEESLGAGTEIRYAGCCVIYSPNSSHISIFTGMHISRTWFSEQHLHDQTLYYFFLGPRQSWLFQSFSSLKRAAVFHVRSHHCCAIWLTFRMWCLVDRKCCDLACGRPSWCCVRRGSSGRTALHVRLGGVCVLRDWLLGRFCSTEDLPDPGRRVEVVWNECEDPPARLVLCPCLERERARENHGVSNSSGGDGHSDMALRDSRWRRASTHSRLPANDSRAAVRSDGPAPS